METIHIKSLISDYSKWKQVLDSLPDQFESGIIGMSTEIDKSNSSLLNTYIKMVNIEKANALINSDFFIRRLEENGLPKRCEMNILSEM
jgi:hypothetical protein